MDSRLTLRETLKWFCVLMVFLHIAPVCGYKYANILYEDILKKSGYTKHARPRSSDNTSTTIIHVDMKLTQIVDVDEKQETFTITIQLKQRWKDYVLQWNPEDYGDITTMFVPSADIWIPDIVLYNSADATFGIDKTSLAVINHTGDIEWNPAVKFQSTCSIDIELFPFDTQECHLKLGAWTHDALAVDVRHVRHTDGSCALGEVIMSGVDTNEYQNNTEWDLLPTKARYYITSYPSGGHYGHLEFNLTISRKKLFNVITVIIPCVAICSTTLMVFYLPTECCEKITLCTTMLTCLTFFLNMVFDISPPTSKATPLIGKYLLFIMCILVLTTFMTVLVLNVHFRTPATHTMSPMTRRIFLHFLPKVLLMRPPMKEQKLKVPATVNGVVMRNFFRSHRQFSSDMGGIDGYTDGAPGRRKLFGYRFSGKISAPARHAMDGLDVVAKHMREADSEKKTKEDWQYIGRVLDRFFLWIFTAVSVVATASLFIAGEIQNELSKGLTDKTTKWTYCYPDVN